MRSWGLFVFVVCLATQVGADPVGRPRPRPRIPTAADIQRTMADMGMVAWRAEVTFHSEFHNLTTTDNGAYGGRKEETTETFDVNATIVQQGDPPGAPVINLQMNPSMYTTRTASGVQNALHTQDSHDAATSSHDEWKETGPPDPAATTLDFHYRSSETGAKRFDIAFNTAAHVTTHHHWTHHGMEDTHGDSDAPSTRTRGLHANGATPGLTLVKKGAMFTITGTVVVDHVDDTQSGTHTIQTETVTVHIVIRPDTVPTYEAVIRPAKQAEYEAWIPKGPPIPNGSDDKGGNQIALVVEIRDLKTGKLAPEIRYTPTFKIDGSHAPGWCMDYPPQKTANEKPDLFFDAANNPRPVHAVAGDGSQLDGLMKLMGPDRIIVSSRDYGAYGRVHAHLALDDGTELLASYTDAKGQKQEGIPVPEDDNNNHVADPWEKAQGIFGKGYPSTWDAEEQPAGMAVPGDGYDLYEEYRGFYLADMSNAIMAGTSGTFAKPPAPVFQRLDPSKRDLLVMIEPDPRDAGLLTYGALLYGKITGITVRLVTSIDQLAHLDGDGDADHPRWSKFNAHPDAGDFGPKQAAVWVRILSTHEGEGNSPGTTYFTPPYDVADSDLQAHHFGSPMTTKWVGVDPAAAIDLVDALASNVTDTPAKDWAHAMTYRGLQAIKAAHPDWHLDAPKVKAYANAHRLALADDLLRFVVVHELGHATGARHHGVMTFLANDDASKAKTFGGGDPQCPMRYWHYLDGEAVVLWLSGHWDPADGPDDGGSWKFCGENWPTMKLWDGPGGPHDDK